MNSGPILIYMTCAAEDEAEKIASALLEQQLIACANIMAPHKAIYRWEGKIETGEERAVIMKTRADLFERVKSAVCALHSYDCPCIVAWPLSAGHEPFLNWIADQTAC